MWQWYNSLKQHVREFSYLLEFEEEREQALRDIASIRKDIEAYRDTNKNNLLRLDELMGQKQAKDLFLRAEIKRHLGDKKAARRLLLQLPVSELYKVKQYRKRMRQKDAEAFLISDRLNTRVFPIEYLIEGIRKGFGKKASP
jgi:hypothetical protein